MNLSRHGKERSVERVEYVNCFAEAKRNAKIAYRAGKTISYYNSKPQFSAYLQARKRTSNNSTVRVYKGNIYIWRGKHKTLTTVLPIPGRFIEELEGERKSKS